MLKRKKIEFFKKNNQGFTLIELLVVIALIGILMAISLAALSQSKKSARDTKRKSDLEQIRSALEIYRTDCRTYPADLDFGGTLVGLPVICNETYLTQVPNDPTSPTFSYYYMSTGANNYTLCAHLETGDDVAAGGCGSNCNGECNYAVFSP